MDQSLGRARELLDALAEARQGGLRFTDLARVTGFSKATLHRLLAGLSAHGFIESGPDGRYFLGFRLAGWGAAARDRHGLVERASPELRWLAQRTGDTAYLSIRVGVLALCVARQEGPFPIRALPLTPGDWNALGVGSGSLALLAFLPVGEIEQILADPENAEARERRRMNLEVVRQQVADAQRQGYVIAAGLTPGMTGLALPVRSRTGRITAAVSLATISERLQPPRLGEVLLALREAAERLAPLVGEIPDP